MDENGDTAVFLQPAPPPSLPVPINGEQLLNGVVSNGHSSSSGEKHRSHHKSSSKDKHRDKDRGDHKSSRSSSSSHHHSSSSSSKDRHSSSSSHRDKDKDRSSSSSHKTSSRDKDRDKDKEKHRHSSSSSSRDKDRDKDKHRDKDKERDKHRDKDKPRDKDKERSKDHKSSTHDKDKPVSTSSSSRDKPKHDSTSGENKDKDRQKTSSSSSSSKHKHSSSSSSKHRDKDRSHHSSKSSNDKERSKHRSSKVENHKAPAPPKNQIEDDDDDDVKVHVEVDPLNTDELVNHIKSEKEALDVSQASSCDYSMSQFKADESQFIIKAEQSDNDDKVDGADDESQDCSYANNSNNAIKVERNPVADDEDEDDIPIAKRQKLIKKKPKSEDDDEEDIPLTARKKVKTEKKKAKKKKHQETDEEDEEEYNERPKNKKIKKEKKIKSEMVSPMKQNKGAASDSGSPMKGGRKKKEEEQQEVWKWWEEEKRDDGVKWHFLEHKGPVFAPPYDPLPDHIQFYYDGKAMKLSQDSEEIACFYAKMLSHDFTSKPVFNDNFFGDWRKAMTGKEKEKITKLKLCDFTKMHKYFTELSEKNKSRTKEEKATLKADNAALVEEYGFCTIDGHKEKIGNFRIEPPGLFRGRGEHPKMGKIKKRVMPEDILINCSRDSQVPQAPKGRRWREVKHDNSVTWLASWQENVQGQVKYVMLNPSSKLKGEKDWQKYETARRLHKHIDKIRSTYREEWKSKEMRIRQRGVALYFIDKLALRAGNEKDEDQADTVGCCSLRVEHIELHKQYNDQENVVVFDFLGKDSIRYYNAVPVEKRVFKNLELFKENKKDGDDLFDRLNTVVMNEHLRELMEGLTAKVFRTYNASWTLQCQLNEMTDPDASLPEKLLAYNRANRAVAVLCNHQRAVPKSHEKSMENLKEKIRLKREQIDDYEQDVRDAVKAAKRGSAKEKIIADKKKKMLERIKDQLKKLELQETDRDENKTIALGTSKLNYLDPRISVAWCKKHNVPIDKIYNKTQRDKFRWAIDMATEDYHF